MSLPNFIEKSEAEILSPLLEGRELVLVQDLGDEARCCSSEVARNEACRTSLDSF